MIVGLGVGGKKPSVHATQSVSQGVIPSSLASKHAIPLRENQTAELMQIAMQKGHTRIDYHPCAFRKKNQRQIRLERRRKHAAGFKAAFPKR